MKASKFPEDTLKLREHMIGKPYKFESPVTEAMRGTFKQLVDESVKKRMKTVYIGGGLISLALLILILYIIFA